MRLQASLAPPLVASPSTASSSTSELAQPQGSFAWASPFSRTPSSMSPSPLVSPVVFGTQVQAQARAHANVNGHAPAEILREWRMANPGLWHVSPYDPDVREGFF